MFEFHDIEQNTPEWLDLRCAKLTSSNLGKVMANFGKAFGDPAKKLAVQIAIEQITGFPQESGYSNDHMERGHEQEPLARAMYEDEMFCTVSNGGFFASDFLGCSPDGLVNSDGVTEFKSVIASVHYANLKRQSVDPAYRWQCIGNVKFTGRDWIDFASYSAEFPIDKQLFVYRMYANQFSQEFKQIDERTEQFRELVNETRERIQNSNYTITNKLELAA